MASWAPLSNTMQLLSGLFAVEETPAPNRFFDEDYESGGSIEELLTIIKRAEYDGVESEALDNIRSRLEDIEREAEKELTITVCQGVSGKVLTTVRARPTDTVAVLREAVLSEIDEALVTLTFFVDTRVLREHQTLESLDILDGEIVNVVLSPLRCLTASLDGTCRVCAIGSSSDEEASAIVASESGPILSALLSPDGDRLLTVCSGGDGSVRGAHTGELLAHISGWIGGSCAWSPDGSSIVGPSDACTAKVWCPQTGRCIQVLTGHSEDVKSAAFSPDGEQIVTASADTTAAVWEATTGCLLLRLAGHGDIVRTALFGPDGVTVLTTSMDGTGRLWDVPSNTCFQVLEGHTKALSGAQFSPDGQRILTASFDGTVRVWEQCTGECLLMLPAENSVVNAATFSPDGNSVLVASASERLRLFCAETGECRFTFTGHEDWVRVATFSSDGTLVASGSYDGTARIWSARDGQCIQKFDGHHGALVAAALTTA